MRKLISVFIILLSAAAAFSQTNPKRDTPSPAKAAFDRLKTLSGTWQGSIANIPMDITIRPASSESAVLYEANAREGAIPGHEITMFYLEGDRLMATHYCDAGNRVRWEGKLSPGGKSIEFKFVDVAGGAQRGLLNGIVFTFTDATHHTAAYNWQEASGKVLALSGDFERTK